MWHPHSGVRHRGSLFDAHLLPQPGQWQQLTSLTAHVPRASGPAKARRRLRHALQGLVTLEVSAQGAAEVVDEAQEVQEGVQLLNRFLRSEQA